MTVPVSPRGWAPVAHMKDLGPVEIRAIECLRLWSDGPEAQSRVWNDFARLLGAGQGRQTLSSFEALWALCGRYGRRPLLRHDVGCACVGADESCFANFIGYASEGAREDAMLLAMNIVRPDAAGALVCLAEEFGCALKRMALKVEGQCGYPEKPTKLH